MFTKLSSRHMTLITWGIMPCVKESLPIWPYYYKIFTSRITATIRIPPERSRAERGYPSQSSTSPSIICCNFIANNYLTISASYHYGTFNGQIRDDSFSNFTPVSAFVLKIHNVAPQLSLDPRHVPIAFLWKTTLGNNRTYFSVDVFPIIIIRFTQQKCLVHYSVGLQQKLIFWK